MQSRATFCSLCRWTQLWDGQLSEAVCRPPNASPVDAGDHDMLQSEDGDAIDVIEEAIEELT
jgi:hypothetical protein